MKKWLKKNKVELILGIGLSLFLINFFTEQDDDLYIFSIPLVVVGSLMMYKRHYRAHLYSSQDTHFESFTSEDDEEFYEDAREAVIEAGKASTSYLQRKLRIGYSRAARLIDMLEANGVIGPANGAEPRVVNTQNHGKKTE